MIWTKKIILAFFIICILSYGHKIGAIKEVVDVSKAPLNTITITVEDIESSLFEDMRKPGILDAKCTEISPMTTKDCNYKVYSNKIVFTIITLEDVLFFDHKQGFGPKNMRPGLYFRYTPLNFLVADEKEDVGERIVRYNLPTFGLFVEKLKNKRDVVIQFSVHCPSGGTDCIVKKKLELPTEEYYVGDVVVSSLPELDFAIWALFDKPKDANTEPLLKSEVHLCFNCSLIDLPLSYKELECDKKSEKMCDSQELFVYALYRMKGDSEHLINASINITVHPAFFPVEVYLGKGSGSMEDVFFRGESMIVSVVSATDVGACTLEFYHDGDIIYKIENLPSCLFVPIQTDTSWPLGRYLVRAVVHNKNDYTSMGTAAMFLITSGNEIPVPISTDKDTYIVGEHVNLFVNTYGERCEVELLNFTGISADIIVKRTFPCGNFKFELPNSLPAGLYQMRVKVYRGEEYGVHLTTIKVQPWIPQAERGSDLDRLCVEKELAVQDISIPCIGPQIHCTPNSEQYSVCLCFNSTGGLQDVCDFKDLCTETGCHKDELKVPFTIVEKDGEKMALMGLEKIPLVDEWDFCPLFCMCTDKELSFYHMCGAGEMCSKQGCFIPELGAHIESMYPHSVRLDAIARGEAQLQVDFALKHKGKTVIKGLKKEDLTIYLKNRFIPSRFYTLKMVDFKWQILLNIPKDMASEMGPGQYPLYITLTYENQKTAMKRPINIFFATEKSALRAKVTSTEPNSISVADAKFGAFVKFYLSVIDEEEKSITDLTRNDVEILAEGEPMQIFSLKYIHPLRVWVVTTIIKGTLKQGTLPIVVNVNKLGRTGQSGTALTVMGVGSTRVDINTIMPGSQAHQLYQILQRQGFDLNVIVSVKGKDIIPNAKITAMILDNEGNEVITKNRKGEPITPLYISSTQLGYRLHFADLAICEPEIGLLGWYRLKLIINVQEKGKERIFEADRPILFSTNPGNWSWPGLCQSNT